MANAGRFRYTGQMYFPEYGLYSYKARFYSPTLGRFMQADPIGYGDGVNLYNYVGSDPVNHRDPSGLCRDNAESVDQCGNFSRQNGRETGEGAWLWNYISSQNQGDGYGNGGIGAFVDVASVHGGIKADYIASRNAYAAGYNIHGRYVGYNPLERKRVEEIYVFAATSTFPDSTKEIVARIRDINNELRAGGDKTTLWRERDALMKTPEMRLQRMENTENFKDYVIPVFENGLRFVMLPLLGWQGIAGSFFGDVIDLGKDKAWDDAINSDK